tara:strand:+ start:143 stop:541 length:399 start_codon:yes stop_codon:yes gene_type:complete
MRTIQIKEINTSTKEGRLQWLDYKNNPEWSFLSETGVTVLFEKITNIKNWIITGKGFINCGVENPYNLNLEITDLKYKYNQIELTATEDDVEKFVEKLMQDEASFKVTGYFEKDSKEHQYFMYGPDNIFKPE